MPRPEVKRYRDGRGYFLLAVEYACDREDMIAAVLWARDQKGPDTVTSRATAWEAAKQAIRDGVIPFELARTHSGGHDPLVVQLAHNLIDRLFPDLRRLPPVDGPVLKSRAERREEALRKVADDRADGALRGMRLGTVGASPLPAPVEAPGEPPPNTPPPGDPVEAPEDPRSPDSPAPKSAGRSGNRGRPKSPPPRPPRSRPRQSPHRPAKPKHPRKPPKVKNRPASG